MSQEQLNEAKHSSIDHLPKSYTEVFNLVAKYGIAAVIALYLVYFLTTTITNSQENIARAHEDMNNNIQIHMKESSIYLQEISAQRKALVRICINTAKTDADRQRCVE